MASTFAYANSTLREQVSLKVSSLLLGGCNGHPQAKGCSKYLPTEGSVDTPKLQDLQKWSLVRGCTKPVSGHSSMFGEAHMSSVVGVTAAGARVDSRLFQAQQLGSS